jgi:hypothetical protein
MVKSRNTTSPCELHLLLTAPEQPPTRSAFHLHGKDFGIPLLIYSNVCFRSHTLFSFQKRFWLRYFYYQGLSLTSLRLIFA